MNEHLKSRTLPELTALFKEMGQPAFRAKQVYWTVKRREEFDAIREADAWSIFEGFIPR